MSVIQNKTMTTCEVMRTGNFQSTYLIAFKRFFFLSFLTVLKVLFPADKYFQLRLYNSSSEN